MVYGRRYLLDLVDWSQLANVAEMVEKGTMQRGDMKFGPLKITIYEIPGQSTLRVDFKVEE